jgi:hypothetical protein
MVLLILIKTPVTIISPSVAGMPGIKATLTGTDGVDIYKDSAHYETYYVGSIEDSEWIKYTIDATTAAPYDLKLNLAVETTGQVSVDVDDKTVFDKKDIAATGSLKNWQTQNIGKSQFN